MKNDESEKSTSNKKISLSPNSVIKAMWIGILEHYGIYIKQEEITFFLLGVPNYSVLNQAEKFQFVDTAKAECYFCSNDSYCNTIAGEYEQFMKTQMPKRSGESYGHSAHSASEFTEVEVEIKQTLKLNDKEFVVRVKNIENTAQSSLLSDHCLFVGCLIESQLSYHRDVLMLIFDELLNCISKTDDIEILLSGDNSKIFELIPETWLFQRRYVNRFLKNNQLPSVDVLNQLSACFYEGSENHSRIYFSKENLNIIECLDDGKKEEREITSEKIRMVRKLMEISCNNKVYLLAETVAGEENRFFITKLVAPVKDEQRVMSKSDLYIKFDGFLHWSVVYNDREMVGYYQGKYRINHSDLNTDYIDDIRKIAKVKKIDEEMLLNLTKVLKEQKHGTSVILVNHRNRKQINKEVDRLCKKNRGVRVSSCIQYDKKKDGWNKDTLLSITSIDGALMMDWSGKCLAIGVIVDGEAKVDGNVGRGARYNSITNYVKQKRRVNYNFIGIIVSEDGMINVITNFAE